MSRRLPAFFDACNDVDRATGLRYFEERHVRPGQVLFAEGQPAEALLCVLEGELEVRSGEVVLAVVGPGDLVGEMALFERSLRTASVRARSDAVVLVLDREGYERLRDVMHPLGVALEQTALNLQIERMRALGDRIARLAEGTPWRQGRPTARFLARLREAFGVGGAIAAQIHPIATLAQSPIFKGAPVAALKALAPAFGVMGYSAGHLLCTEGEMGSEMFLLAEGEVDVVVATEADRVQHLATLEPGAAFGMVSLAQDRPRMATCVARTAVAVLVLERPNWDALLAEPHITGSAFRRALLKGMSEQISFTNHQLAAFESDREEPDLLRAGAGVDTHGGWMGRVRGPE